MAQDFHSDSSRLVWVVDAVVGVVQVRRNRSSGMTVLKEEIIVGKVDFHERSSKSHVILADVNPQFVKKKQSYNG